MCGIFGELASRSDPGVRDAFSRSALNALRRRGPDGSGVWSDTHCLLGHTRLSIIDLSDNAAQPMHSSSGESHIAFNGEIYNYLELRAQLETAELRSSGDTAVLLELFEKKGLASVQDLIGMFAFALWRPREHELWLVRDRLGKKPLYFSRLGANGLRFASEIAAMLDDGVVPRRTSPARVAEFLQHGYIASPRTGFCDVEQLVPGGWLRARLEGDELRIVTGRYWDLPFAGESRPSRTQWNERVRETLSDAVRIRLRSDVPIGAFLSGGIDSSVVSLLASRELGGALRTFTVDFDEAGFSEAPFAAEVARRIGVQHSIIRVTSKDLEDLPDLLAIYGDLFGDSSALPTAALCRAARNEVKVAIAGDGGDEVFGGYTRYHETLRTLANARRIPDRALGALRWVGRQLVPHGVPGVTRLSRLSHSLDTTYSLGVRAYLHATWPDVLRRDLNGHWPDAIGEALVAQRNRPELLRMMACDAKTYLPDDILVKVDRASMAWGLEVRAPLLDHRLFELAMQAAPDYLLLDGSGKRPLSDLYGPHLPKAVFTRRKMGFGVPISKWFRRGDSKVGEKILESSAPTEDLLDRKAVERVLRIHRSGLRDESQRLWQLMILSSWLERWRPRLVEEEEATY